MKKLCYFLVFSIFLPYLMTAAALLAILVYLLVKTEYRNGFFTRMGSNGSLLLYSLFLSPVLHRHWLGLAVGVAVMILLLIGI